MNKHELNLQENALDSLIEALNKFEAGEKGDSKAYKFAVLHMSHFVELILKYHVAQKHPLLLFKDPFARKLDTSKTITLWDAVNFIENEAAGALSREFRADLEWLKRLRNDIEHHKFSMDVSEVRSTMGRLFRSLKEFIDEHTDVDIEAAIPARAQEIFTVLSDEYEFKRQTAIRAAEAIAGATFTPNDPDAPPVLLECPSCNNLTLVINAESESGYRCTFCGNEESDDLPATCDICGVVETVGEMDYWALDNGHTEVRCYYCSGRHAVGKDD